MVIRFQSKSRNHRQKKRFIRTRFLPENGDFVAQVVGIVFGNREGFY